MFGIVTLTIGIMMEWLLLGIARCPERQQAWTLAVALTCATVRIVILWFIYRIARGWMALNNRRPMYAVF